MSYFDNPPEFLGEMPLPEDVGDTDPGILALKANADHSHAFVPKDWQNVLLAGSWTWFGGNTRVPQYTRIGTLALLRGVFGNATPQSVPSTLGSIPVDYCPQNGERELFPCGTSTGYGELDVMPDGRLIWNFGINGITWLASGTIIWSID